MKRPDLMKVYAAPACPTGKTSFESRARAWKALSENRSAGGAMRNVYRCPECRWWHLTTLSQREWDEKRRSGPPLPRRSSS